MGRLDQAMAWPLTAQMLVDFLQRPEWDRPNEGLHFEHKRELSADPSQIPKAVAAFSNSEGGFLFVGAEAVNGVLTAFPGLPRDQEWGLRVSNLIVGHVSPLPAWRIQVLPCPHDPSRDVLVVLVEESSRPPHIVGGMIYVRTPGGASEALRDRATMDRLIDKGREGQRLVEVRLRELEQMSETQADCEGWKSSVITVPLPLGIAQRELLTQAGYGHAATGFRGELLGGALSRRELLEDAVELTFNLAMVRLFEDGAVCAVTVPAGPLGLVSEEDARDVEVPRLSALVRETLQYQAGRGIGECAVSVVLRSDREMRLMRHIWGTIVQKHSASKPPPNPWRWTGTAATDTKGIDTFVGRMEARLWRSAGDRVFDDQAG
jgi:hypothetical protein